MRYLEELPPECPPSEAKLIETPIKVFRLVKTNPPTTDDFKSQLLLQPRRKFKDECIARGLSVWSSREKCKNVRRLPVYKNSFLCKVSLDSGAGHIKWNGDSFHHTWWPFATYNIINCCIVEKQ